MLFTVKDGAIAGFVEEDAPYIDFPRQTTTVAAPSEEPQPGLLSRLIMWMIVGAILLAFRELLVWVLP